MTGWLGRIRLSLVLLATSTPLYAEGDPAACADLLTPAFFETSVTSAVASCIDDQALRARNDDGLTVLHLAAGHHSYRPAHELRRGSQGLAGEGPNASGLLMRAVQAAQQALTTAL